MVVVGGGGSDFGQVQLSPREGQIPDSFRQVWTGFRKNLPEPVRVPYLTKPGPNLTEGYPHVRPAAGGAQIYFAAFTLRIFFDRVIVICRASLDYQ